ncbi:MAG: hypothetical protein JWM33_97 [Caulobacteraceae bacterium]|nr:hypothetical protein [Caulobacteraceae bacterium]
MSTVIIEDQPEPAPTIKRTTIIEEQTPAPKAPDVVINPPAGSTVIVEDEDD